MSLKFWPVPTPLCVLFFSFFRSQCDFKNIRNKERKENLVNGDSLLSQHVEQNQTQRFESGLPLFMTLDKCLSLCRGISYLLEQGVGLYDRKIPSSS